MLFIGALVLLSLRILEPVPPRDALGHHDRGFRARGRYCSGLRRALNRRTLAVAVMTGAFLLVFVLPFLTAVAAIVANAEAITEHLCALPTLELPPPPAWLERLPFVGEKIAAAWHELEEEEACPGANRRYLSSIALWFASSVGSVEGFLHSS